MKEEIHNNTDPDQEGMVLTNEHNELTINLGENENFSIELFSNKTTGFQWEITNIDETIIEEIDLDQYEPTPTNEDEEPMLGGGGKQIFAFKTLSVGETKLNLCYRRAHSPCEKDNEFNIDIIVK